MKIVDSRENKIFGATLFVLMLIFFLAIASGAGWGLPAIWHADEVLHQVMPALSNGPGSAPLDVFYPTLPFYSMFAAGKLLSLLTPDEVAIMAGIRILSAVLGALVIGLSAFMTLTTGRSRPAALVAALLLMFSSGFATIAHHALVDVYLTFFVTLASFLLLGFVANQKDSWLYLGFLTTGLAASSKYNGASLLLGATAIAILFGASHWRKGLPGLIARLALADFLALLGFFTGTPRALLDMQSYQEELMPFLERQRAYAGPREMGIFGQWDRMLDGLGTGSGSQVWPIQDQRARDGRCGFYDGGWV